MVDLATSAEPVIIIGATNRPDSLDPALRRAGRFDHEIEMGVPTVEGREQILRVLCASLRLSGQVDFHELAKATPGYVGADLTSLTGAAGVIAVKRIFQEIGEGKLVLPEDELREGVEEMAVDPPEVVADPSVPFSTLHPALLNTPIAQFLLSHPNPLTATQLSPLLLIPDDFTEALKIVQPSAKREGFATVPDISWADIGALKTIRDELHMAIVQPIRRPELFHTVGIDAPSGVLLWGPPGCGKTLLAKAVANESRANFISVKGPELLNKYVGESEKAVRQVFARARASSPCVIFFDELDALVPRRDDSMSESSARVVNTLLTELDGLDSRKAVYVVGATNRPDMIDPAMVRPGRLDKLLYVDLPSASERVEILKTHTKRTPVDDSSWPEIAEIVKSNKCDGFSGADMAALVREAATLALRSALEQVGAFETDVGADGRALGDDDAAVQRPETEARPPIRVSVEHFRLAADKTMPSVSREQQHKYERMRAKYAGTPVRGKRWKADVEGVGPVGASVGGEAAGGSEETPAVAA
jgi:ribosome biogenesis ATPase